MLPQYLLIFIIAFLSCNSVNYAPSKTISSVEIVAISLNLTTQVRRSPEMLYGEQSRHHAKARIDSKKILRQISKHVEYLKKGEYHGGEVWMAVKINYSNGNSNLLGFSGYIHSNFILSNGVYYQWNQDFANLLYNYLPESILSSLPKEIR